MVVPENRSSLLDAPWAVSMFKLGVPGVVGALIFSMLGAIEIGFIARQGTEAVAAVALVFPLIMLSAMFSAGAIGGAVSGATARAVGSDNLREAEGVLVATLIIAVVGGLLMGLTITVAGPALYARASDSNTVVSLATEYSSVVFPAIVLFWLVNMLSSFLRGTGDMIRPAVIALVMVIAYALAATLIMPNESVDRAKAMRSAAWSIVISYVVALVVASACTFRRGQVVRFRPGSYRSSIMKALLKQGLLASSQSLMTVLYTLVATLLFGRLGVDWLAGYGLAVRLELIMVPVIFGLGGSLIAIVGVNVGAGLHDKAIAIAWKGVFTNALIVGLAGLCFAWQPQLWCGAFGSSAQIVSHCSQSLQFIGPTYGFFAIGLGCYFASQALNTLQAPVAGALLRLVIVSSGIFWVTSATSPTLLLSVIALAVVSYGVFVAVMLYQRGWSKTK